MRVAARLLWLAAAVWSVDTAENGTAAGSVRDRRQSGGGAGERRIVCYYTNWSVYRPGTAKFSPQNINPYLCTHLIYAFGGLTKENALKPFDKYQDVEQGGYAKFNGLKSYNKNLKTLVAIGGWNEGSARFSPLVADHERRRELVKNTIRFLRQNHFDGLDLDWEYPSFRDGGKPRDRDNYATLVQELREEFDRESAKTGRQRLLLTMAVPAGIEYIDKGYDVPRLNRYLDWMNILSYDYHSAFEPTVNHHSPLFALEEDDEYNFDAQLNIDHTVKHYLSLGADRSKLVLGIPTYGRSYTLFNPDASEVGAAADGPGEQGDATREKGYLAYYEICERVMKEGWTVRSDFPDAMGPYAVKGNQWVGYDDEHIARAKAKYVAEHELGGIMFWSIDNDDFRGKCHGKQYPLIEAAKEALLASSNELVPARAGAKPKKEPSGTTGRPKKTKPRPRKPSSTTTTTERAVQRGEASTTTPKPPTTPDPGSDFVCKDEGFFPHPRDCKKYFWCLDSGPSSLGIVAHQFTCPSGLVFNKISDSCDYARNVICKTKAETTTAAPSTTESTTAAAKATTGRTRVITAAPPRHTTTSTTTTTTTEEPEYEEEEEEGEEQDPGAIKELLGLIKRLGGVEQLEKQLNLQSEESGEEPSIRPIKPSLYTKVLGGSGAASRLRGSALHQDTSSTPRYTSVFRNRSGPQNSGLTGQEDTAKAAGSRQEKPQYVTIQRNRPQNRKPVYDEEDEEEEEEEVEEEEEEEVKRKPTRRGPERGQDKEYVTLRRNRPQKEEQTTPRYKSILRTRSTTEAAAEEEEAAEEEQIEVEVERRGEGRQDKPKKYSSVIRDNKRVRNNEEVVEEEEKEEEEKVSGEDGTTAVNIVNTGKYVEIRRRTTTEGVDTTPRTDTDGLRGRGTTETVTQTQEPEDTTLQTSTEGLRRFRGRGTTETTSQASQEVTPRPTTDGASRFRGRSTTQPSAEPQATSPGAKRFEFSPRTRPSPPPTTEPTTTTTSASSQGVKRFQFAPRTRPSVLSTTEAFTIFTIIVPETTTDMTTETETETTMTDTTLALEDTTAFTETPLPVTAFRSKTRKQSTSTETSVVTSVTESSVTERHKITVTKKPLYRTAYEKLREKATTASTTTTTEAVTAKPRPRFSRPTTGQPPRAEAARFARPVTAVETPRRRFRGRITTSTTTTEPPREFVPKKARGQKKFSEAKPSEEKEKGDEARKTARRKVLVRSGPRAARDDLEPQQSGRYFDGEPEEDEDQSYTLGETVRQTSGSDYVNADVLFVTVPTVEDEEKTTELPKTDPTTLKPSTRAFRGRIRAEDSRDSSQEAVATSSSTSTTAQPSTAAPALFRRTGSSDYLTNLRTRQRGTTSTTSTEPPETTERTSRRPGVQLDRRRKFRPEQKKEEQQGLVETSPKTRAQVFRRRGRPTLTSTSTTTPASPAAPAAAADSRVEESKDTADLPDLAHPAVVAIHNLATSFAPAGPSLGTTPIRVGTQPAPTPSTVIRVSPVTPGTTPVLEGRQDSIPSTTIVRHPSTDSAIVARAEAAAPAPVPKAPKERRLKPFSKVPKQGAAQSLQPRPAHRAQPPPAQDFEYYDDADVSSDPLADVPVSALKVKVHSDGYIECLDRGNFPHPFSCKKFISCAKMENNELLGWEYTCPKHLSFDPVGGICNWSAGLGCQQ